MASGRLDSPFNTNLPLCSSASTLNNATLLSGAYSLETSAIISLESIKDLFSFSESWQATPNNAIRLINFIFLKQFCPGSVPVGKMHFFIVHFNAIGNIIFQQQGAIHIYIIQ